MISLRKTALAAAIGTALAAPCASALAQTTLTFSTWVPPTHHLSVWQRNWAADLEKATAGRIKVQELPKAPAAPPGVEKSSIGCNTITGGWPNPVVAVTVLFARLPSNGSPPTAALNPTEPSASALNWNA